MTNHAVRLSMIFMTGISLVACAPFFEDGSIWPQSPQPRAVEANLKSSIGYYESAVAAINGRHYALALEYLQAARSQKPDDVRVLTAFGVVYDKLGRFDLSARYYAQAVALDPKSRIIAADIDYSRKLQGILSPNVAPILADAGPDTVGGTTPPTVVAANGNTAPAAAPASQTARDLNPSNTVLESKIRIATTDADYSRELEIKPLLNSEPVAAKAGSSIAVETALRPVLAAPQGNAMPLATELTQPVGDAHPPLTELGPKSTADIDSRELNSTPIQVAGSTVANTDVSTTPIPRAVLDSSDATAMPVAVMRQNLVPAHPQAASLDTKSSIAAGILEFLHKLRIALTPDAPTVANVGSNLSGVAKSRTAAEPNSEAVPSAAAVPGRVGHSDLRTAINQVGIDSKDSVTPKLDLLATDKLFFLTGHPLTIVDASGRGGTDKSVRSYLSGLHWSIVKGESEKAQARLQTTIIYKEGMATAAKALARTLSLPPSMNLTQSNNVEGLQLILGSDISATNFAKTKVVVQAVVPARRQLALAGAEK